MLRLSDGCKRGKQELIDVLSVISNQTQYLHISAGFEDRCTSCNEIKTRTISLSSF